jgi:hypothetical protein
MCATEGRFDRFEKDRLQMKSGRSFGGKDWDM